MDSVLPHTLPSDNQQEHSEHNYPASPYNLFWDWFHEAELSENSDPDAAALASVDTQGLPDIRMVLIRRINTQGFCFFTNFESAKGRELLVNPLAALNFHWKSLRRQVRVRGHITVVSNKEADEYYASRPLGNRIAAWASQQSRPLKQRSDLIDAVRIAEQKYGSNPPRPPYWSGFRLVPRTIEFWREGEYRLHHRALYSLKASEPSKSDYEWNLQFLYP